ncbi:hypothetical protein [Mucilaginibacter sp. dw_454]|uniref:hypothetical protein n=1 Tax=Mucilaginibacter sp. dw_454 TaxID=2720079 RepID=UPI001BD5B7A1|nr:hypothetical protein [Mucilaginibacter sp. dw_454]
MNQQVDNAEYEFLWKLLANPADPNHSYIFNLQSLVSDYPQSGALHALLMPNGDRRYVKHAAAYFNPVVLHKLATAPDSLRRVSPEQIIFSDVAPATPSDVHFKVPYAEPFVPPQPTPETEYTPVVDDTATERVAEAHPTFAEPIEIANAAPEPVVDSSRENVPVYINEEEEDHVHPTYTNYTEVKPEPEVYPESVAEVAAVAFHEEYVPQTETSVSEEYKNEAAKEYEEYMAKTDLTAAPEPVSSYEEDQVRYFHQPIEDEVYDEIVSIEDIGLEQLAILNRGGQGQDGNGPDENYFVFEPEISGDAGQGQLQQTAAEQAYAPAPQQDQSQLIEYPGPYYKDDLSRYNDEKMPYSFMWWLDKTRKEHAYIYQPYAANGNATAAQGAATAKQPQAARPVVDELQKQYYQNIVSNTAFTDLDANATKISTRKEDKIIERFIQEEPHIKHPTDIKLDNENKAKRSSEDKEELVTETLARIYTEQMLYHKAIITYKKLMLKYPEKSLYFAGQIEYLENKIN